MDLMLEIFLILLGLVLVGIYSLVRVPKTLQHIPRVPLSESIKDLIYSTPFDKQVKKYASLIHQHKVVLLFNSGQWMVVTSCEAAFRQVFTDIDNFPRLSIIELFPDLLISKFLAYNIATSNGERYRKFRKVVAPAFRAPIQPGLMVPKAEDLCDRIDRGEDVAKAVQRATVEILGSLVLGIDFASEGGDHFISCYNDVIKGSFSPIFVVCPSLDSVWNPIRRHLHEKQAFLDDYMRDVYQEKLKNPGGSDIMSKMLMADHDHALSFEEMRANVMGLFTAGHETTASSICSTLYLLAHHPFIQEKARSESHNFHPSQLDRLTYLNAIIMESLRIFPSVARQFPRIAQQDFMIRGFHIPKTTHIMLDSFSIHHDPELWTDPESFDPTRFLNSNPASFPDARWSPFLGGTHQCQGIKFTMIEQKIILATLLNRYQFIPRSSNPNLSPSFLLNHNSLEIDFIPLN